MCALSITFVLVGSNVMVRINTKDKELIIKLVYYGPGLSGKTTNLQYIHKTTDPKDKTKLISLNTS